MLPDVEESTYTLTMEKTGFETLAEKHLVFSYQQDVRHGTLNLSGLIPPIREPGMTATATPFGVTVGPGEVRTDGLELFVAKYSLAAAANIAITWSYEVDSWADFVAAGGITLTSFPDVRLKGSLLFNPATGALLSATTTDGRTWTILGTELTPFDRGFQGSNDKLSNGDSLRITFSRNGITPIRQAQRNMNSAQITASVTP